MDSNNQKVKFKFVQLEYVEFNWSLNLIVAQDQAKNEKGGQISPGLLLWLTSKL